MEGSAARGAGRMNPRAQDLAGDAEQAARGGSERPLRRRANRHWIESLVGACAILISAVSLYVAINANRTQERMLAASVWPSLLFATSNASTEGEPQISFDLLNRGIGPARMRWAELRYAGTPVRNVGELLERCCRTRLHETDGARYPVVTSGVQNRVIGIGEWVPMLRMPRAEATARTWEALDRERHKVQLRACYCSVLDDCWLYDSDRADPEPVSQCPAPGKVLWQG
jgi:hypothetical protein